MCHHDKWIGAFNTEVQCVSQFLSVYVKIKYLDREEAIKKTGHDVCFGSFSTLIRVLLFAEQARWHPDDKWLALLKHVG